MKAPCELGVAEALALLSRRELTSEALVRSCLERIAAEEPRVLAWEFLDPEMALARAREIDARSAHAPLPLGGLPVGVKDIIDTAGMPTQCGSPIRRGHRPAADAACVAALRSAGAVILGKTVTTEFAVYQPGKTRNPHDPSRTPGGSSSGSAAAVAARMIPAAVGTQTAGSVIRPAAFCGVVGFKPSHALLPIAGVTPSAPTLDTLGVFARSVEDLTPLVNGMGGALPPLAPPSAPPRVGICRTDVWPLAAPETVAALEAAAARLAAAGADVRELELSPELVGLTDVQKTIQAYETARSLARERREDAALLSASLRSLVDHGAALPEATHREALARAAAARRALPALFAHADVLITPATVGEAPGIETTGDPAFARIWTLLHVPCLALPAGKGPSALPVGIQLVGPSGGDAALLRAAAWIEAQLA